MKNEKCNNHAITLIALIITIIILLILAGVTISAIMGENGLFGTAKTAAEKMEVAELKEKADIAYTTLKVENYEKEILLLQIVEELKKQGYTIVTKNDSEQAKIIGITVNPETLLLRIGESNDIEVIINKEATGGTKYYANMHNAYYEISLEKDKIKIRK